MLMNKQKKNQSVKGNRILISITVIGSAGPIRFVVNEEELVGSVIYMALKAYAREGRLPVLGSDMNQFLLYCPHAATAALNPMERIGSHGTRNFMLCMKPQSEKLAVAINAGGSENQRKVLYCWIGIKDFWNGSSSHPQIRSVKVFHDKGYIERHV